MREWIYREHSSREQINVNEDKGKSQGGMEVIAPVTMDWMENLVTVWYGRKQETDLVGQ